jgi:predicted RNase H-like HicB family nuclease
MNIKVIIEKDEDGFYIASVPSLPGCISQGKTEKAALKNIKEAIKLHVKTLAEDGIPLKSKSNSKEKIVTVTV